MSEVVDFVGGVSQGIVASASFGAVGAPKSSDSTASLWGQAVGTIIEGSMGTGMRTTGAAAVGAGLVAEAPSAGTSTTVVATGAVGVLVGSAAEAGAAKNVGAILNAMSNKGGTNGSNDGMKPGSAGGPGAGKKTTPQQREETLKGNGGKCVVPGCNQKAEHADHAIARSKNGDTTNENLQGMCAHHNCQKGAKSSAEYEQWRKDNPDKK